MMDQRYVVNWSAIIDGLRRQGFTFSQLSQCTGIARTTLERYRDGATPKHPDGETLVTFWCSFTHTERDRLPLTPRLLNGNARK